MNAMETVKEEWDSALERTGAWSVPLLTCRYFSQIPEFNFVLRGLTLGSGIALKRVSAFDPGNVVRSISNCAF